MTVVETALEYSSRFESIGRDLYRRHRLGEREHVSRVQWDGDGIDPLGDWWRAHLSGCAPVSDRQLRPTIRTVDLFCGPGGLGLGFRRACDELGIDVVAAAAVDQDAEALDVYAANHGARRRSTESVSALVEYQVAGMGTTAEFVYEPELVKDEWADLIGRTDVILAGPPCQGHSNLNNKTRRVDRRNELYLTVPALAVALQAPVVIIENVPAVVHDRMQVVGSTVTLLENAGYSVETGILRADHLGWAQTRQRFFVIARKGVAPIPVATMASALASPPRSVTWAIGDLEQRAFDGLTHINTEISAENQRRIEFLFENGLYDLPPEQRPDCHKDGTTYNAVYGRLYPDRPAPTITTGFMTAGRGRYIHPTLRRVLTPLEAARIQGFPDSYRFHVDPDRPPAKAKLAKWIGDAVPMPLGHAAGLAALLPGWD